MDMQCVLMSDFGKVCRICMKFSETFLRITSFKIIEMISECSSVQISENDCLPNQICNTCFLQLQNSINFKLLCETSDVKFRQIVEQNIIKVETDVKDETIKTEEIINCNLSSLNKLSNKKKLDDIDVKIEDDLDDNRSLSSSSSEKLNNENHDEIFDKNLTETFTCEKCNKEFKKSWVLGQHMHRAHRVKALKCSQCETKCYHVLHLKEHEELAHNPLNHTCDICKRVFTDVYKLKRHKSTHSERSHHCQRCDKSFKDKWALKRHNQESHSLIGKKIACHVCGKSILKKNLALHMEIHSERDKLSCSICLRTFLKRQSLENHIKYTHENQTPPKRKYLCNVCGRAIRSLADLRLHLLTHTQERPFACDHCDKTYRCPLALKKHVSRAHLDERKYVCTFCSQAFYEKRILLNHVRRHTGERPYKCQVCDKAFIQKVALTIHMKVHTNST